MSRNDWEGGTLKIPTAAWKTLRDGLATAFNTEQDRLLAAAVRLHAKVLSIKAAAPRGTFCPDLALKSLFKDYPQPISAEARDVTDRFYDMHQSMCVQDEETKKWKLVTPRRKDFPHAVPTKEAHYVVGCDASITLDHKARTVRWSVSENNHAVEHAHEQPLARAFFRLLKSITWTRGTGGEFVGNDEYNRDNRESGGGSNYTTATYGPTTKSTQRRGGRYVI